MTPHRLLSLFLLSLLALVSTLAPAGSAQGNDGVGGIEHVGGSGIDDEGNDTPKVGPTMQFDGAELGDWTDLGTNDPDEDETDTSARLAGHGPGSAGSLFEIWVEQAQPEAAALLVIGASTVNAPYKGHLFVPSPDLMLSNIPVNELGGLHMILQMPDDMPPGVEIFMQFVLQDGTAASGVSMTNAVRLVTS